MLPSSSMEHMGILSALLPDIHINHLYIYVREQIRCHVYGVNNITPKKVNTSLYKAPIHLINVDASKLVILII